MRLLSIAAATSLVMAGPALAAGILPGQSTAPATSVSTSPANGDQNPYGVAFVPKDFPTGGVLQAGDILVSNFNDATTATGGNQQGTGTTIVDVRGSGSSATVTPYFQGIPTLGLSTALKVLGSGFVIVGNIPTPSGACTLPVTGMGTGSLLILDANGNLVESFAEAPWIDGPWDMTVWDSPTTPVAFVSNAYTGTVVRLDLVVGGPFKIKVHQATVIASGYTHACNSTTFVQGPTGLAYDAATDALYVASTADNAIYRVPSATVRTTAADKGKVIYDDPTRLNGPLHLAIAPNGDLVTGNNDNIVSNSKVPPSEYVEFTKTGTFVAAYEIDPSPGGAFGFAFQKTGAGTATFAAVDDNTTMVEVWSVNY